MLRKIGIYYHPSLEAAHRLAEEVRRELGGRVAEVWLSSAWDPHQSTKDVPGTDLLICIGGDGTVLRAARTVIPHPTLILGVDMGRLAFLTEVLPAELLTRLPDLLHGNYQVEERSMLDVHLSGFVLGDAPEHTHALNDVIMGRTSLGRPVYINVQVNGDLIGLLRADAVIVATATGSTGYSLSAGGPILDPIARSMVITPAAPHLAAAVPLVLPEYSEIELRPASPEGVAVSIDGQGQYPSGKESAVSLRRSKHVARMVRFAEKPFFAQLGRRLAWLEERRLRSVSDDAWEGANPPDLEA